MFHIYKKAYGQNKQNVVILLSGWQVTQLQYWLFSKLLDFNGYYCLTYTYDKEILSPDPKTTVRNITKVVNDVLDEISLLKQQGTTCITLFGTSMGTIPAILVANNSVQVKSLILNTSGFDIAQTIWSWDKIFPGFKTEMIRSGITLNKLSVEWESINPKNNLEGLKNKRVLLLSSKVDEIIPFEQAKKLFETIRMINNNVIFNTTEKFGHLVYGAINLIKASYYMQNI